MGERGKIYLSEETLCLSSVGRNPLAMSPYAKVRGKSGRVKVAYGIDILLGDTLLLDIKDMRKETISLSDAGIRKLEGASDYRALAKLLFESPTYQVMMERIDEIKRDLENKNF